MWRAYFTRSRSFNVYVGADLFMGAELLDMYYQLTAPTYTSLTNSGYSAASFIFGAAPRVELEWFLTPYFALTAAGRFAFTSGSQRSLPLHCLRPSLSAGLRVNF